MKLETKNGVNFSGTVTELFALEAGIPTYRHGFPARTLMPRRPVNVNDGYGNIIRMPSIKAAWRFYVKIAGDTRFFPDWHNFHNALRGKECRKGLHSTCGARFGGTVRYMNYTFKLA